MIAGRIKCDFCDFIGEMEANAINKGQVSVPSGWIGIHPTVVVYGMRGLSKDDPRFQERAKIKEKVLDKIKSIHCCPGCVTEKNVFNLQMALPVPEARDVKEKPFSMKN